MDGWEPVAILKLEQKDTGRGWPTEGGGGCWWTACLLCVCLAGMCQAGLLEKLGHEYDQEDFFLSGFPF